MNKKDIKKYVDFLSHDRYDIRAFTPRKSDIEENIKNGNRWAKNKKQIIQFCEKYDKTANIYAGVLPRTKKDKKGIKKIDKIWIELDAKRREDDTASKEILERAEEIMESIRNDYREFGFPMVVMSGNGYHMIWKIKPIPVNDKNREKLDKKLKSFIKEIKKEYEIDKVEVDTAVGDLARILKIPGTTSVKGKKEHWRESKIVYESNTSQEQKEKLKDYFLMLETQKSKITKRKVDENFDKEKLEKLKEKDEKLKNLIEGKWEKYGYPSRSEAAYALIHKLLFFEVPREKIYSIMKQSKIGKWNDWPQSTRKQTLDKAERECEKTISDYKDVDDEIRERLYKEIFEHNNYKKKNTKFVTFRNNININEEHEINFGDTYELRENLAEELKERNLASTKLWMCINCKNTIESPYKPSKCDECGSDKKKNFRALHPYKPEDIADTLKKNYHFMTLRETITESRPGDVHIYTGGVYKTKGAKGLIRHKTKKLRRDSKQADQKHVIDHIATTTDLPEEEIGIGGNRLVVLNGTLDLDTMEMNEHSPDQYALCEIDVKYKDDAKCPKFKEYLKEDMPKKEDRKRLQELLGTALVNKKLHKKGGIIVGPTDSGKSTLINIIKKVFGEDNISSQSPHSLSGTRWGKAKLQKVLLNTTDEVKSNKLKNLAILKKILDGNSITAEKKGQETFEFKPTCEHIFAANQTPSAKRKDDAFWNRWIVMEMPNSIPENEQDPNLVDKIIEEKSGILNWMIEGYKDFMENGQKFTYSQSWEDSRDRWLDWGDSIQRFIQNCLVKDEGNKISSSEMYDEYQEYVDEHQNLEVESQKKLTGKVKELHFVKYSNDFRFNGKQGSGFKHVKVVTNKDKNDYTNDKKKQILTNNKLFNFSNTKNYKKSIVSIVSNNKIKNIILDNVFTDKEVKIELLIDRVSAECEADDEQIENVINEMLKNGTEIHEPRPGKIKKL